MIFICTHKDFDLPKYFEKHQNDICILDGGEIKNSYPLKIIHETSKNNILYDKHFYYGDLTRHYFIYKNKEYKDEIIGFMQYKRFFSNYVLDNYQSILNDYNIILPGCLPFNIIKQYYNCHGNLLNITLDLIYKYRKSYRNTIDKFKVSNNLVPHNMFIMKYNDFTNYCKFLFSIFELLNIQKIYKYDQSERCYSFLAERLSSLFYIHYFNKDYIYYDID